MPELILRDGLRKGMRETDENERNSDRLINCYNARPGKYGLVQHTPISYPSALATAISGAGESVSHPFPQLFRGSQKTLLFSETKVYDVNESTWALTPHTLVDLAGSGTTIASGGGAWQFADFGTAWWAFNGVTTVFYAEYGGSFATRVDTSVPVQTGCAHRGRAIFGGFDSSNYWNSTWDTNIAGWTDAYISNPSGLSINGIGSNFVSWSSIGGGDTMGMLYPDLMVEGHEKYLASGHDSTRPIFFDFLDRNECGFMPMDWQGSVWCVKPLGDNVVVYGNNGISALIQASGPVPTFGLHPIAKYGIASRTAVGGDENGHVFLDSSGTLWYMGANLQPQRLDYKDTLQQFVGDDISIVQDPQENEFHITGTHTTEGRKVYTLTETGLYRHKHAPTSAFFLSGGMVGIYETLSNFDTVDIRTDTIDFETRSIKTIHSVELSSSVSSNLSCRIFYRADSSSDWSYTSILPFDSKGRVDILASGVEFQIQIYDSDYTNFDRIDYIRVNWRESGVRNFRGSSS